MNREKKGQSLNREGGRKDNLRMKEKENTISDEGESKDD